ncbi:pirin family protein [Vibrio quintilis]|uniref:Quercetin 2,3-dioxygenase n=1 Tax=Vibrio quintilis TaxID=1117707 RepID=A0A1M7YR63_9VIBR|nr:pirin family protein [Vibrio quintilis]SHO55026.1 Quercetin 2,3-dioxygenase [Vibrio quintilis]
MPSPKTIRHIRPAQPTSDGDGVKIRRIAGFGQPDFSPFLMIDELKSETRADYVGGFPPHPHRGIETLTYMLQGHFQHRDHMGNVGELKSGGAQWMAAGRGVIHSEMPVMENGALHGFQIWINQPAKSKMLPAQYHDFQTDVIAEYSQDDLGVVRVIAGEATVGNQRISGPLQNTGVPVLVSDWRATRQQQLALGVSAAFQAMLYVYRGEIKISGQTVSAGHCVSLSDGDTIEATAVSGDVGSLILAGQPIHEPIVHYGPFVMNTMEEIDQTIRDYQSGAFERLIRE